MSFVVWYQIDEYLESFENLECGNEFETIGEAEEYLNNLLADGFLAWITEETE